MCYGEVWSIAADYHTCMLPLRNPSTASPPTAPRDLYYPPATGDPHDTSSRQPDVTAIETRASAASAESYLYVSPQALADNPGLYTLRLRGDTGSPTVEVIVATPGPTILLADKELGAMQGVAKQCCSASNTRAPFCANM